MPDLDFSLPELEEIKGGVDVEGAGADGEGEDGRSMMTKIYENETFCAEKALMEKQLI